MDPFDISPEPLSRRYARRLVTIPSLLLIAALYAAALPILIPVAIGADLYRRRRGWPVIRTVIFVAWYLISYLAGLCILSVQWLLSGVWAGGSSARLARWTLRFGENWTSVLYHSAMRIFSVRTVVEGDELLDRGPIILFMRHCSVGDPVIPFVFVTAPHKIYLRHVIKNQLLVDPVFDLGCHRWQNAFIRRQSGHAETEIGMIARAAKNLADDQGVVMWPEGTRYTPAKRARVLAKLAKRDPEFHRMASKLEHTLPPHRGGPTGLLEANERADVVFCAHTGLEKTQHVRSFLNGSLIGATIHIRFWRVPFAEIPGTREERIKWLYHWWGVMDRWIGETHAGAASGVRS